MKFSIESATEFVNTRISQIPSPDLKLCCSFMTRDYYTGYGGSKHHHNFVGGLLVHTAEVLYEALALAGVNQFGYSYADKEIITVAALLHDHGKLFQYKLVDGNIVKTDYAVKLGHLTGSVLNFMRFFPEYHPKKEAIIHAMLSHHGRKEWGSPVEPATREAWILHVADMISSRGQNA